jgi:hypothetical protein
LGLLAVRGTPYVHGDFRGGLNTKAANYLLEDSQCRDCLNVQSTTTGAIVKRQGVSQVASQSGVTFKSLHASEATADGDHFIAATDTGLYKVKAGAVTSISGSWSSGYWSQVEATAQDGQGPVFMVNGANSPQEWDGTTLGPWTMDSSSTLRAPGSAVPNGKYLLVHESRVLIAGEDANPSTLFWSEVQVGVGTLPRRWMIENQQLFDPDDGDEITGIGRAGSNVLVFKKHKVFVVYDLNTGASRRLTTNIGCVSHRSIVETPMGTVFLAENGVYITNGSTVELVSDQITPTITALSSTNLTVADFYRNHYYLSSPADNVILDYDLGLKSWWKHTLASGAVYDFTSRFNNSTEEFLCVSGGKVGQLFVPGVYQDFGSSFTWKWSGPWLAPGQAREVYPAVRKRLRALRVDGNGTATLTLSTDFNAAERAATPQDADGTPRASLFGTTSGTTFGPIANDGTYFGDYCNGSAPVTVISPTVFGDVQGPQQARVWGQGVARSWSVTFKDSVGSGAAATIQNYTIFTQERNQ